MSSSAPYERSLKTCIAEPTVDYSNLDEPEASAPSELNWSIPKVTIAGPVYCLYATFPSPSIGALEFNGPFQLGGHVCY
jgi:hypothetical protein